MKKNNKWKKFILYPIAILFTLFIILVGYKLNQSSVTLTENGIYKTLHTPIKSKFIDFNINLAGAGDATKFSSDFIEGPIVTYEKDQSTKVDWFYKGKTYQKTYTNPIQKFSIDTEIKHTDFILPEIKQPISEFTETPEKIVFISDVHGDLDYMNTVLKKLKVIDSSQKWNFKNNHLVIAGDMVDRGTQTTEVLWQIVKLSDQAEKSGGKVHYLIGNHEQYILRGNFSRVNPSNLYAIQQMTTFKNAFSEKTYLGKWLRSRPVVIKIGTTIITHGGISLQTAKNGHTIKQINKAMWDYWNGKSLEENIKESLLGKTGVTQYRGYTLENNGIKKATQTEINEILKIYDASSIIVGHTNVPCIEATYQEKIYNINAIETTSEILMYEKGLPKIININVLKKENTEKTYSRAFSFKKSNDWKMIFLLIRNIVKLSCISHPY